MNILSPITPPDEIKPLVKAGASEFYCGFISSKWFGMYKTSPNARDKLYSNLRSLHYLKKTVKTAHALNTRVYVTFNNHYFSDQYTNILSEIKDAVSCDIDAIIVSDIFLLNEIKGMGIETHISSRLPVFNTDAVKFLKRFKIKRIILPRQVTLNEIKKLTNSSKEVEFEVFILNSKCRNIDGFCCYHHLIYKYPLKIYSPLIRCASGLINKFGLKKNQSSMQTLYHEILGKTVGCNLRYEMQDVTDKSFHQEYKTIKYLDHCAACNLYEFKNMNIKAVKIAGRENTTEKKLKDVRFLKSALDYLMTKPTKMQFMNNVQKLYNKFYRRDCNRLCYFQ